MDTTTDKELLQTTSPSKLKAWIGALRLRTLPLALSSILVGNSIALNHDSGSIGGLFFSLLTATLLQILSNLANDYGDSKHGADAKASGRTGPMRAVQSGVISPKEMLNGVIITAVLTFLSGLWLLYYCIGANPVVFAVFLGLGLASIAAAITYTMGKKPYGYMGLGDLFVFVFFGFVGVLGTATLMMGPYAFILASIWGSIYIGTQSTMVLHLNNIRDMESDARAGKRSLALRLGYKGSLYYFLGLIFVSMASGVMLALELDLGIAFFVIIYSSYVNVNKVVYGIWSKMTKEELEWDKALPVTAFFTALAAFSILLSVFFGF